MADAKASARAAKANREGAVGLSNMDEVADSKGASDSKGSDRYVDGKGGMDEGYRSPSRDDRGDAKADAK